MPGKKLTLTDLNRIRAVSARDVERMTLPNQEAAMKHHLITTWFLMGSVIVSGTVADAKSYSGSTVYQGTIRRVASNANGTRTVTNTDASGAGSSRVIAPKAPGIYVPDGNGGEKLYTPPPRSNVLGSTTYEGVTTTVTDSGDGTHTVTNTDAGGAGSSRVITPKAPGIYVPDGNGGEKLYMPPPRSNVLGSTTYEGVTTTVTDNGNGTRMVTNTDAGGAGSSRVIAPKAPGIYVPDGNGGEKLYAPPPRSNVLGSTTYEGVATTVTDNGDGTHTVTKIYPNGLQTSQLTGR